VRDAIFSYSGRLVASETSFILTHAARNPWTHRYQIFHAWWWRVQLTRKSHTPISVTID